MSKLVKKVKNGIYVIDIPHLEREVYVCKERRAAFKYGNGEFCDPDSTTKATTIYNTRDRCTVAIWFASESPSASTVAHECLHALNAIHAYVGIIADRYNDEADAYMLSYLVENVYKALRKIAKEDECK